MEYSKYELCIFNNDKLGICDFIEGYNSMAECLERMKEIEIDDLKEHFTIVEYTGDQLEEVENEYRYNSKQELIITI